jgi:predicted Zn finger-like uncharacterized protein
MKFSCDQCEAQYMIADERLGTRGVKVKCKKCDHMIVVRPARWTESAALSSPSASSDLLSSEHAGQDEPGDRTQVGSIDPYEPEENTVMTALPGFDSATAGLQSGTGAPWERATVSAQVTPRWDPSADSESRDEAESDGEFSDSDDDGASPSVSRSANGEASQFAGERFNASAPSASRAALARSDAFDDGVAWGANGLASDNVPMPMGAVPTTGDMRESTVKRARALADRAAAMSGEVEETPIIDSPMMEDEIGSALDQMFGALEGQLPGLDAPRPYPKEDASYGSSQDPNDDLGLPYGSASERPDTLQANSRTEWDQEDPSQDEELGWFVAIDDEQLGPLPLEQIRSSWARGRLDSDSLCWRSGMSDWLPISKTELSSLLGPQDTARSLRSLEDEDSEELSGGLKLRSVSAIDNMHLPNRAEASGISWKPSAASALASLAAAELGDQGSDEASPPVSSRPAAASRSAVLPSFAPAAGRPSLSLPMAMSTPVSQATGLTSAAESLPLLNTGSMAANFPSGPATPSLSSRSNPYPWMMVLLIGAILTLVAAVIFLVFRSPAPAVSPTPALPSNAIAQNPAPPAVALDAIPTSEPPAPAAQPDEAAAGPDSDAAAKPPGKDETLKAGAGSETVEEGSTKPKSSRGKKKKKQRRGSEGGSAGESNKGPSTTSDTGEGDDDLLPSGAHSNLPAQLDDLDILKVLKTNRGQIQSCLSKQTAADPSIRGEMKVRFVVERTGKTRRVEITPSTLSGQVVGRCVHDAVGGWAFPRFSGAPMPVDFPVYVRGG